MSEERRRPVRPRWVWAGTVVGVAGLVLLGIAATTASWWWALVGAVVLAAGLAAARHGRIMRDVHGTDPGGSAGAAELRQVERGEPRPGVRAGEMVHDPTAQQDAARTEARRRALVRTRAPRGRLYGAEGGVLIIAAVVLVAAQMFLYPSSATGESNDTAMLLPVIVLGWCGIRLVTAAGRPHRVAGALALAAAVFTLLWAVLSPHQQRGPLVVELVCGAVAAVAAAWSLVDE